MSPKLSRVDRLLPAPLSKIAVVDQPLRVGHRVLDAMRPLREVLAVEEHDRVGGRRARSVTGSDDRRCGRLSS